MTTLEAFRPDPVVAQYCHRTLADFLALLAVNNHPLTGQPGCKGGNVTVWVAKRGWNQIGILGKVFVDSNIDDKRRGGRTDETGKL